MKQVAIKYLSIALIVVGNSTAVIAGQTAVSDPGTWYEENYGPLWHEKSWEKLDEILTYYHSEIRSHSPDGEPEIIQSDPWIREAMKEWRAEGWTGSEVPDVRVNRINDSTASFTTRWVDHYNNQEDGYSCAWYLADKIDGHWKFTGFATIDCAAHGF